MLKLVLKNKRLERHAMGGESVHGIWKKENPREGKEDC